MTKAEAIKKAEAIVRQDDNLDMDPKPKVWATHGKDGVWVEVLLWIPNKDD